MKLNIIKIIMDAKEKACIAIIIALAVNNKKSVRQRRWMKDWLQKRNSYSHVVLLNDINTSEEADLMKLIINCCNWSNHLYEGRIQT